jgi:hypothetical protein
MKKNKKAGGFTENSLNNFKSGNPEAFRTIVNTIKIDELNKESWIQAVIDASQTCGDLDIGAAGVEIAKEAAKFNIKLTDRHKKLANIADKSPSKNQHESSTDSENEEDNEGSFIWSTENKTKSKPNSFSYKVPTLRIENLKNRNQNVTNWFRQFEIHTRGWKDEIRGLEVAKYFEGIALQKYELMAEDEVEYESIKKHMIEHLQSSDHSSDILTEFFNAKQRPDENVDQYGHRLLDYVKEAPIEDRQMMEQKLAVVFKKGCTLEIQKLIMASTRETFKDLWEDARKIEKIVAKSETSSIDPVKETVDAIKKALKCYNCKKEGHIAKDCRAPKTDNRKKCNSCGMTNHDSSECRLAKLLSRMLQQVSKQNTQHPATHSTKSTNYKQTRTCNFCKKTGHLEAQCRRKFGQCLKCGEAGHKINNCTKNLNA